MLILVAEVGLLRGVAAARADVAALDRDRAEQLEEVVDEGLHEPERAAAAVVEDRGGAGLLPDREQPLGDEVERLVPRDLPDEPFLAQERRRDAVGGRTAAPGSATVR